MRLLTHEAASGAVRTSAVKGENPSCRLQRLFWEIVAIGDLPEDTIDLNQGLDAILDARELDIIERLHLTVFDSISTFKDAHRLGEAAFAVGIERVDAVIVFVSQLGLLTQATGSIKNVSAAGGRRPAQFGQALYQIHARSWRIQCQEDDDGGFLVSAGEPGNHMDQQAFRVCPGVVELAHQK